MDETGLETSAVKLPKLISIKGKKQVGVISFAERGELATLVMACNATVIFCSHILFLEINKDSRNDAR